MSKRKLSVASAAEPKAQLGYIEISSYSAQTKTLMLSGWVRTAQKGLIDAEVVILLGKQRVAESTSAILVERSDIANIGHSFVLETPWVADDVFGEDAEIEVRLKGGLNLRQRGGFIAITRESHLVAVSQYVNAGVDAQTRPLWNMLLTETFNDQQRDLLDADRGPSATTSLKAEGMIERLGPKYISGWVRVRGSTDKAVLSIKSANYSETVVAELRPRADLSLDVLSFDAREFKIPIPTEIHLDDVGQISVYSSGVRLEAVRRFVVTSPAYFRALNVYGGMFDALAFDVRQPEAPCEVEVVTEDGKVFPATRRFRHVVEIEGEPVIGEIAFSADLSEALKGKRSRVMCRLVGSKTIFGEVILDVTQDGMRLIPQKPTHTIDGKVDQVGPHFVGGWVQILKDSAPKIELRINKEIVGRVRARRERPDVTEVLGQPAKGFLIPLPNGLLQPGNNEVEVVRADTKTVLRTVQSVLVRPPAFGEVRLTDRSIRGYVLKSSCSAVSRVELVVGPEVLGVHWLGPHDGMSRDRFEFEMPLPDRSLDLGRASLRLMPENKALPWADVLVKPEGKLVSNFEGLNGGALTGWLFDSANEAKALGVLITVDGRLLGEHSASDLRSDLRSLGITALNHGFRVAVPSALLDGRFHEVSVLNTESMVHVTGSPTTLRFPKRLHDLPVAKTPHLNGLRVPSVIAKKGKVRTSETPDFSLIILNKDAGEVLERAFESIEDFIHKHTIEIILVDHASTDNSIKVVERWSERLPILCFCQTGNNTFSYSNNFAAKHARGKYLAFVNNDIVFTQDVFDPIYRFLSEREDVGLVGIKLLELKKSKFADPLNDFKVHHLGIAFVEEAATGRPRPMEILDDRDNAWRSFIRTDVAAVTGAFCVMRSAEFEEIGGFDQEFFYGYEDVTLGLKVRQKLKKGVVNLNDVVSFHHRGFMRLSGKMDSDFMGRVRHNDKILADLYGRYIRQGYRASLFSGDWVFSAQKLRVGFIVYDASSTTEAGDFFTAKELSQELTREIDCEVLFVDAVAGWGDLQDCDVVVNMRNELDIRDVVSIKPGSMRVAWLRNNFEDWLENGALTEYDYVLCSSNTFREKIEAAYGVRAIWYEIASNAQAMSRGLSQSKYECDVLFNGSFAGANRSLAFEWADKELPFSFKVFGAGWEGTALERYWCGFASYDSMPDLYASTKIVIDDANQSARKWGGTNSRVFDAASAGKLVITNSIETAKSTFAGSMPVWTNGEDLVAKISHYLGNPLEREAVANELKRQANDRHTYTKRARILGDLIKKGGECRRISIRVAAPSRSTKEVWGDIHFAEQLAYELRRLGYVVRVQTREEWENGVGSEDFVIGLRGLVPIATATAAYNLLWVISHPDDVSSAELMRYDHVFAGSKRASIRFSDMGAPSISVLPQCASLRAIGKESSVELCTDILYAGNTRGELRSGVRYLEQSGHDFDLIGYGWENFSSINKVLSENLAYDELLNLYAKAKIVVNDHWKDMREWGIISNRVFDVAAAGGCVVTDDIDELSSIFGNSVTSYADQSSFESAVKKLLSDEKLRADLIKRSKKIVLEGHLYEHRAGTIHEKLQQLISADSA